jgi:uncharacterized membrane protein YdjX (TVP38/TMEM64 family)
MLRKLYHNNVFFRKTRIFRRKPQKIVIITLNPGFADILVTYIYLKIKYTCVKYMLGICKLPKTFSD